jgi:hypothetical protein
MGVEWSYEFFRGLARKRARAEAAEVRASEPRSHTASLVFVAGSGGSVSDHTAFDAISTDRSKRRAEELRREYDADAAKAERYLSEIVEANPTNGAKWAEALRLRYVIGLEWFMVSERMGVCERSVYLWHRTALDWLDATVAPGL